MPGSAVPLLISWEHLRVPWSWHLFCVLFSWISFFFLVFSNILSTHKHCFLHAQQDPSSPIQYSTIPQISMVNEFPVNTPPTFTPNNCSTQHTSLIGGWVAYLVNKTFVEAQLARPVEYETAVLTSCFFKKELCCKVKWGEKRMSVTGRVNSESKVK